MPLLFLAALMVAALARAEQPGRPDIVVFLADDLGQLDSAPYGGTDILRRSSPPWPPNSLTFTAAYVACPSCAPSRAALLTDSCPPATARSPFSPDPTGGDPQVARLLQGARLRGGRLRQGLALSAHSRTTASTCSRMTASMTPKRVPPATASSDARPARREASCLLIGSNWPHVPWPAADGAHRPAELQVAGGQPRYAAGPASGGRATPTPSRAATPNSAIVLRAVGEVLPPATLTVFTSDHGAQWRFANGTSTRRASPRRLIIRWPRRPRRPAHARAGQLGRTSSRRCWKPAAARLRRRLTAGPSCPCSAGDRLRECDLRDASNDNRMNVYPARSVRDGRWKYLRNLHPDCGLHRRTSTCMKAGATASANEPSSRSGSSSPGRTRAHRPRWTATTGGPRELYDPIPPRRGTWRPIRRHAEKLAELRTALTAWMKAQGDDRGAGRAPPARRFPPRSGRPGRPPLSRPPPASVRQVGTGRPADGIGRARLVIINIRHGPPLPALRPDVPPRSPSPARYRRTSSRRRSRRDPGPDDGADALPNLGGAGFAAGTRLRRVEALGTPASAKPLTSPDGGALGEAVALTGGVEPVKSGRMQPGGTLLLDAVQTREASSLTHWAPHEACCSTRRQLLRLTDRQVDGSFRPDGQQPNRFRNAIRDQPPCADAENRTFYRSRPDVRLRRVVARRLRPDGARVESTTRGRLLRSHGHGRLWTMRTDRERR